MHVRRAYARNAAFATTEARFHRARCKAAAVSGMTIQRGLDRPGLQSIMSTCITATILYMDMETAIFSDGTSTTADHVESWTMNYTQR